MSGGLIIGDTSGLADIVMNTSGDMVDFVGGVRARLPIGSENDVLTVSSSVPAWVASAGGGAETHEFTTEETFTPTTQTGIMEVLIDTTDMTAGSIKTTVDSVIDNTISSAKTLTRIFDPSTSITLISQAGGMGSSKSYEYGTSQVPAGNLVSVNIGDSGSKMYLASNQAGDNQSIYEYDLATPYNVTTASYSGNSFPDPVSGDIRGMDFKSDGTTWIRCSDQTGNKKFYQFNCTAWDISSSGSSVDDYDYSGTQSGGKDCIWGNSGTQVTSVADNSTIYTYTNSAYQLNCSPSGQTFDCSGFDTAPRSLCWNSDGTKIYLLGSQYDKIYTIVCSSAWNVSTGSHDSADDIDVNVETSSPYGLANSGGVDPSEFYVGSTSSLYKVYEYELQAFSGSAYATVGQ